MTTAFNPARARSSPSVPAGATKPAGSCKTAVVAVYQQLERAVIHAFPTRGRALVGPDVPSVIQGWGPLFLARGLTHVACRSQLRCNHALRHDAKQTGCPPVQRVIASASILAISAAMSSRAFSLGLRIVGFDDTIYQRRESVEPVALFFKVLVTVINAADAGHDVSQAALRVVGRHTRSAHERPPGAAQIVQRPAGNAACLVEGKFEFGKSGYRVRAIRSLDTTNQ
jgi:hypothetical protein